MIADRASEYTVTSNVQGVEQVEMTIDPGAFLHLMTVLTDLYSDPELAVLREYSTNARDAMIAAGRADQPIEVTLPTVLEPYLTIKDTGIGMDAADIRETYALYGKSTKQDTNEQQGMLGLGCKSGFTYSPQFTLVGIKDHRRIEVLIAREEGSAPTMTIVSEMPSTEPNGVTVIIPARRHNSFASLAADLFSFWEEGTVLVNGQQPERAEGLAIGENILVVDDGENQDRVVMGNVPYPTDLGLPVKSDKSVIAFVPIGDVHFTPSREALAYTSKTKATIERLKAEFTEHVSKSVQAAIDKAQTPGEALRIAATWRDTFDIRDDNGDPFPYSFKGQRLPFVFKPNQDERFWISRANSHKLSEKESVAQVYVGTAINALWIYDWEPGTTFSAATKKKLNKYADENGIEAAHYLLCQSIPDSTWIDPERVIPYETIKAIKLPRTWTRGTNPSDRPKGSYSVLLPGDMSATHTKADEIPEGDLYFVDTTRNQGGQATLLRQYDADAVIVQLTSNRVDKFRRDFSDARPALDGLKKIYSRERRKVSKTHLTQFAIEEARWTVKGALTKLDAAQIEDPVLRGLILTAKSKQFAKGLARVRQFNKLARTVGKKPLEATLPIDLGEAYPLLSTSSSYGKVHPHNYIYINAVYQAEKGSK